MGCVIETYIVLASKNYLIRKNRSKCFSLVTWWTIVECWYIGKFELRQKYDRCITQVLLALPCNKKEWFCFAICKLSNGLLGLIFWLLFSLLKNAKHYLFWLCCIYAIYSTKDDFDFLLAKNAEIAAKHMHASIP